MDESVSSDLLEYKAMRVPFNEAVMEYENNVVRHDDGSITDIDFNERSSVRLSSFCKTGLKITGKNNSGPSKYIKTSVFEKRIEEEGKAVFGSSGGRAIQFMVDMCRLPSFGGDVSSEELRNMLSVMDTSRVIKEFWNDERDIVVIADKILAHGEFSVHSVTKDVIVFEASNTGPKYAPEYGGGICWFGRDSPNDRLCIDKYGRVVALTKSTQIGEDSVIQKLLSNEVEDMDFVLSDVGLSHASTIVDLMHLNKKIAEEKYDAARIEEPILSMFDPEQIRGFTNVPTEFDMDLKRLSGFGLREKEYENAARFIMGEAPRVEGSGVTVEEVVEENAKSEKSEKKEE